MLKYSNPVSSSEKLLSAYKYRIYPTEEQEVRLRRALAFLCGLYNELRSEKVKKYKEEKISLTKTDLRRIVLDKRRTSQELKQIHSQVVQNVADRVSTAFANFLEHGARFPKIKKYKKYLSLTCPQSGFHVEPMMMKEGHKVFLSKIGKVRAFIHRPIGGRKIERLSIKYQAGEWYAIFIVEHQNEEKKPVLESVPKDRIISGGDLGLEKFITLDNEESEEYPKFLRLAEKKIKGLQRRLARKVKGSKRYRSLALRLAKLHVHIKRQREDYQNKVVYSLFKKADVLVLEKLKIENLLGNHHLAKSTCDAAFGKFARKALYKAAMLGKQTMFVDPWGTTQFCYSCLSWVPKHLSEREHNCPNCGIKISRDVNSAKLITWLDIQRSTSPPSDGGLSLAELEPLPSLRGMVSQGVEAGSLRVNS